MKSSSSFRKYAAGAALALTLLAPAANAFAGGNVGPQPTVPKDQGDKQDPNPTIPPHNGPDDLSDHLPGGDPDPCPPITCDITSNPGDDDGGHPEDGGGTDGGTTDGGTTDPQVGPTAYDPPVIAHPTFTG